MANMRMNAVQPALEGRPGGLRECFIRDPFRNLIIFAERVSEEKVSVGQAS